MTTAPTCMVLGGQGFVGSAVVAAARARGYDTTAVTRANYEELKGRAVHLLINANGNSRKYLSRADPVLDFTLSVESVLRSLCDFQADRYVFLSSIDVYPDVTHPDANRETTNIDIQRLSPYGLHKYMAEELVRHRAPNALILRMGGFVGAGLWKNSIFDLITGQSLRVHPDSAYQYMNTTDLARIVFELLDIEKGGAVYNVAGHGVITLRDIAHMIPDVLLPEEEDALPLERYEINVDKLCATVAVPETRDAVYCFLRDVMNGRSFIGKQGAKA